MRDKKPIYQWKASINEPWMPENGRCIWAFDNVEKNSLYPWVILFQKYEKHI